MNEVFGFDARGVARTRETNRRVLGALPRALRNTRRVYDASGGGGGPQRVHFTIDSYDSDTGVAICTVQYRPHGVSTVTGEVNGKIDVEDPAGCYFDEEEYDLVDRWGHADLMTANGDTYGEGVWIVSGLCCPPA